MKRIVLRLLAFFTKIKYRVPGPCCLVIGNSTKIIHHKKIQTFGDKKEVVRIARDCIINAHGHGKILIGGGSTIGQRTQIFANSNVKIGKNVLIAPDVYITDHNHEYRDPKVPIRLQGQAENNNQIIISDGAWIGTKVTIVGNLIIGKNSVIGANSVVTKSIPDFCVAVGVPARVIKRYDFGSGKWIKELNK